MEMKALGVVWQWGGEVRVGTVARELKVSLDYARLMCRSLGEHEYLDIAQSGWCRIKGKGKRAAAKWSKELPRRIMAGRRAGRGRVVVEY